MQCFVIVIQCYWLNITWLYVTSDVNGAEIVGTFYE